MRVQDPNGRFYDPEKSTIIGERVTPDGKIQRLQRSVVGAYFFFETPSKSMRSAVTPTTYDEALEWAKKYAEQRLIEKYMVYPKKKEKVFGVVLSQCDYDKLSLIAKENSLSLKDTLSLLAKQYFENREGI